MIYVVVASCRRVLPASTGNNVAAGCHLYIKLNQQLPLGNAVNDCSPRIRMFNRPRRANRVETRLAVRAPRAVKHGKLGNEACRIVHGVTRWVFQRDHNWLATHARLSAARRRAKDDVILPYHVERRKANSDLQACCLVTSTKGSRPFHSSVSAATIKTSSPKETSSPARSFLRRRVSTSLLTSTSPL